MFLRFIQARRDQFKMTNRALFCCVPDFFCCFVLFQIEGKKNTERERGPKSGKREEEKKNPSNIREENSHRIG